MAASGDFNGAVGFAMFTVFITDLAALTVEVILRRIRKKSKKNIALEEKEQ